MKKIALIHRYDNEPDISAVEEHGCSEVYTRSQRDDFELVVVIPTLTAKTELAVVADPSSPQYQPEQSLRWPGRDDRYLVRVDVRNVRYTTDRRRLIDYIAGVRMPYRQSSHTESCDNYLLALTARW